MDAFTREQGTQQGHIRPASFSAPQGEYVFCLGSDREGLNQCITEGDYVEVSQLADFDTTKTVRLKAVLRCPLYTGIVGAPVWRLEVLVDGSARVIRKLVPGRARSLVDLEFGVADLAPGNHTLAFRLTAAAS